MSDKTAFERFKLEYELEKAGKAKHEAEFAAKLQSTTQDDYPQKAAIFAEISALQGRIEKLWQSLAEAREKGLSK